MIAAPEVGFTGTQAGTTAPQLATAWVWFQRFLDRGAEWMNNGDCIGSDDQAGGVWKALGGKLRLHVPDVDAKRAFLAGDAVEPPLPYLVRNRNIVGRSRVLVATPCESVEQDRGGTWYTVRYARKLARPILIILPDGSVRQENWKTPVAAAA